MKVAIVVPSLNQAAFLGRRSTDAMWDYYPHRRRGLRVTIKGDAPFYRP